jgi:hypothetical protein
VSSQQFTLWRSLAMLLFMSVALFPTAADEPRESQQLKIFFQVTIREGPSAGVVGYGVLTLNLRSRSDNFTGTLTPAEDPDTGAPFSSVLFKEVDHKLAPQGDVKQLNVRGTLHGHAINLVMLNVSGEGKDVFGVGTTENAFGEPSAGQGLGHIAGPAVGPEEGDSGDWIVSIQPISFRVPPTINSPSTATFLAFTANSFAASAFGVPGPVFSEAGTLPGGVTFGANGVLSGNPTHTGTFPITITASNGVAPNGVQNFTLVVSRPPTTFASVLSPAPIVVESASLGVTGTCGSGIGMVCLHTLSMTVTDADNPGGAFGAFVANAIKQKSSAGRFSGTLAVGDITIVNSANMFVTSASLSAAPSGSPAATITITYD